MDQKDQLLEVEVGVSGTDQPLAKTQLNATLPESWPWTPGLLVLEEKEMTSWKEKDPVLEAKRPGSQVCLCHQLAVRLFLFFLELPHPLWVPSTFLSTLLYM